MAHGHCTVLLGVLPMADIASTILVRLAFIRLNHVNDEGQRSFTNGIKAISHRLLRFVKSEDVVVRWDRLLLQIAS